MKQFRIVTLFILSLIFQYVAAHPSQERLLLLQSLFNQNIPGNIEVQSDSIIKWGNQLETFLLNNNKLTDYFEVELLMVNAYCFRGDISLGIDRVRRMVDNAAKKKSPLGFALSSIGIGDTYIYSNMSTEAIHSYTEALQALQRLPNTTKYQKITILKMNHALLVSNHIDDLSEYIPQLNNLFQGDYKEEPLWGSALLSNAFYYIKIHQPEKALEYIEQAREIIANEIPSTRTATLHFITANYYEEVNDLIAALEELQKINPVMEKKLDANRYTNLAAGKAELFSKLGKDREAALLYQQIVNAKDSLNARSYSRQVNALRTMYQVSQMEIDNQTQRSRQIGLLIGIGVVLLILGILLALYIIRSTRKLRASKEQLEIAKARAENSMKIKSMILSNMSHEIRTPLNALTGFSAILTEEMIDNETRRQCNDIIQQNSELLLKLIDDVIDLSSLEFGKMQFTFKNQDAIKICRNVTDTVEKVKQTSAKVLFRAELDSLMLYTDEARLQQVLLNLMINATKFTSQGEIILELSLQDEDTAVFSVSDTGCGIDPEKQKRVFERFEKLDERAQGTGLGLSICRLIINHIGGEIWIDPEYMGGSRFTFTHPIHK